MEKCALVTGSSSGLGLEISKFLINSGYTVFGGSRSGTELEHENFYDVELDLTSEDSVEEFFETVREFTSKLDLIVNNAGICEMASLADTSLERRVGTGEVLVHLCRFRDRVNYLNLH